MCLPCVAGLPHGELGVTHADSYFEFDISQAVAWGATNRLAVGMTRQYDQVLRAPQFPQFLRQGFRRVAAGS